MEWTPIAVAGGAWLDAPDVQSGAIHSTATSPAQRRSLSSESIPSADECGHEGGSVNEVKPLSPQAAHAAAEGSAATSLSQEDPEPSGSGLRPAQVLATEGIAATLASAPSHALRSGTPTSVFALGPSATAGPSAPRSAGIVLDRDVSALRTESDLEEDMPTDVVGLERAAPEAPAATLQNGQGPAGSAPRPQGGGIADAAAGAAAAARTTLVLQHLPAFYTRDAVVQMLGELGFAGDFDFVYLPCNFVTNKPFGYAFVNFVDADTARRGMHRLNGFDEWATACRATCAVHWAEVNGLEANIERYRNSAVMHESVSDAAKPATFDSSGARVPFPPPTQPIRASRSRRAR